MSVIATLFGEQKTISPLGQFTSGSLFRVNDDGPDLLTKGWKFGNKNSIAFIDDLVLVIQSYQIKSTFYSDVVINGKLYTRIETHRIRSACSAA